MTIASRLATVGSGLLFLFGCAGAPSAKSAGPRAAATRAAPQPPKIGIQLNRELVAKHGLSTAAVTESIKAFLQKKPEATLDDLSNVRIAKRDGSTIPLSAIATLTQEPRSPP